MIKKVKVVNDAGMPVPNLHLEVENTSFVSDRKGEIELKADNPNSIVKINYIGSPEIRSKFINISNKITVDNGFKKNTCNTANLFEKQIEILNQNGEPLAGISVFSESGLTNTVTDRNGIAIIKVNDPEEYISFDGENIEGQAMSFKSLNSQLSFDGYSSQQFESKKSNNASLWILGLSALGLLWNHSKNQSDQKESKPRGLSQPVKITL